MPVVRKGSDVWISNRKGVVDRKKNKPLNNNVMTVQDIVLLIRKIGIGIVIALIPFLLYFAGLRIVQTILIKS
jgi:hypothetical protein